MKTNQEYHTRLHHVLELLSWGCIILSLWIAFHAMNTLPATIATHFDLHGNPDGYGSPGSLLILPLIMAPTFGIISLIGHFVPIKYWNMPFTVHEKAQLPVYRSILTMIYLIEFEIGLFTVFQQYESYHERGKAALIAALILTVVLIATTIIFSLRAYKQNKSFDL